MKKLIVALMLSAFTLVTFAAAANPVIQQDTTKKNKPSKMKRDTMKKDTVKKPTK